jgi:hypothetical protein
LLRTHLSNKLAAVKAQSRKNHEWRDFIYDELVRQTLIETLSLIFAALPSEFKYENM